MMETLNQKEILNYLGQAQQQLDNSGTLKTIETLNNDPSIKWAMYNEPIKPHNKRRRIKV
ncbi:MAG: hypothetical protein SOZ84_00010 [Treponema sp.]|nr:hypothetical protein [Treponema sp.]